jgi:hypothetical protein
VGEIVPIACENSETFEPSSCSSWMSCVALLAVVFETNYFVFERRFDNITNHKIINYHFQALQWIYPDQPIIDMALLSLEIQSYLLAKAKFLR